MIAKVWRVIAWFIEPLNKATNEALYRENLGELALCEATCNDKSSHKLWNCNKELVDKFLASKADAQYMFKVWVRRGNGEIYPYNPEHKTENQIKAEKRLREIRIAFRSC